MYFKLILKVFVFIIYIVGFEDEKENDYLLNRFYRVFEKRI